MAPDISRAVINVTSHAGRSAVVTIINRLVALRTGGVGYTGVAAGNHMDDVGMWMQAFGSTGDQNDRQGIAGFDADTLGLSFGADTLVSDNLRVGAAFSYANSDVDTKGLANKLDIDNYQGTIYGSYDLGMHYLDASFSYGKNTYDSRRVITVGTVNRIALADFNADQVILQGQYGREYTHADDIYISPYVGLFYANLDIDGYSETGAGTLNLNVDGQSYETLESVLGVSARKEMESRDGTSIMPELHAAWRHEFLDEIQVNTSTYTGGGASFITTGADPANNTFNIGASFSMFLENNVDIKFSYDFDTKSDYKGHSGLINIRYNF
jgi:outer membrane autotransporter protein